MGRKEGSQLDVADVVAAGELVAVGDVFWSSVPEGLVGRSGWSVGLAIRLEVGAATGAIDVVAPIAVVVEII